MKKILFATTALVMTAGVAAAEVAVSGDGRMGIVYDGDNAQFSSRARVKFTLSGETDGGLAFGGSFRVNDEGGNRVSSTTTAIVDEETGEVTGYTTSNTGRYASDGVRGSVYMSGAFGKLSMGDVVGATEAAIGDLAEVGYTGGSFAGDVEEFGFLTGDGENLDQGANVLYNYTAGDFDFFLSFSDGSSSAFDTGSKYEAAFADSEDDKTAYSLALKYSFGDYAAAIGYSDDGTASEIGVSGTAVFGDLSLIATYLDFSDRFLGDIEYTKSYGISAEYTIGATTLQALYKRDEYSAALGESNSSGDYDSYGLGAKYDLGGGATLAAGVIDSDFNDSTLYDFGVSFSF